MRRRKNFVSNESPAVTGDESGETFGSIEPSETTAITIDCASTPRITFPDNSTDTRYFDSRKFLGKQYDDIVLTTFLTIARLLDSAIKTRQQSLSYTTLVSYCTMGLVHLYAYCDHLIKSKLFCTITCVDITAEFIVGFEEFLQRKKIDTQRHIFSRVKKVLTERELGINPLWFPVNTFAGRSPEKPPRSICFTPREHMALKNALSNEIRKILSGEKSLTREELCICLLTLADKTGANLQPLWELDTTSITKHPFHPLKRVLILYKRRNNKNQPIPLIPTSIKTEDDYPKFVEAPPFIEKLINTIILRNERARNSSHYPFRVFVSFTANQSNEKGKIIRKSEIDETIRFLIRKYSLKSENGEPLTVNFERIRKTWINNIYELSDHDPYTTAALANQGIKVSNDHYLQAPPDAKKKHYSMGEARVDELLKYSSEDTIIAKCSDPINGERAPKDGSLCVQVFGCFSCSNFIVTADDLYRLCSFYFYCLRLRAKLGAKSWKKQYGRIIRIISNRILPKFDNKLVKVSLEKSRKNPHPAWKH